MADRMDQTEEADTVSGPTAGHATITAMPDEAPISRGQREAEHLTVSPGRRFGRPCLRDTRISPVDVLHWLADGMSLKQILADHPDLTEQDVLASLRFGADAAEREAEVIAAASWWTDEGARVAKDWEKLSSAAGKAKAAG